MSAPPPVSPAPSVAIRAATWALGACVALGIFAAAIERINASAPTTLGELALRQDRAMTTAPEPGIVIVGASFAWADIDRAALVAAIGPKQPPARTLSTDAANAPVWYAMIKGRIYGNGVEPKLVLLPVTLQTALTTKLIPAQAARLAEQMPTPDDVVLRRSFDSALPGWLQSAVDGRARLRDPVLERFRVTLPSLFFGADAAAISTAGAAVFGEQHGGGGGRLLPVVEDTAKAAGAGDAGLVAPEDSYLADIADLVEAHGGRLAVVLPPVAPSSNAARYQSPAVEEAAVAWANTRGVGWIDLRGLGWDASHYTDTVHMTPTSAREFSAMVGKRLVAAGLLEPDGFGGATVPLVASGVERVGTVPDVPAGPVVAGKAECSFVIPVPGFAFLAAVALGERVAGVHSPLRVFEGDTALGTRPLPGCSGTYRHAADKLAGQRLVASGPPLHVALADAAPLVDGKSEVWWVYPGTSLRWTFPRVWAPGGQAASVHAEAVAFGPGAGAPALVVWGTRAPLGADGTADAPAPTVEGPWSVTIESPADGPYLLVRRLRASAADQAVSLIADPTPVRRDVLDGGAIVEGAELAPVTMKVGSAPDRRWFDVPAMTRGACTPWRILHDGQPLPADTRPKRPQDEVPGAGGVMQLGTRLFLPSSVDAATFGDGAAFQVTLDPDRRCATKRPGADTSVWLYPGDHLQAEVPRARRHSVEGSVVSIEVLGDPITGDHPPVQLRAQVRRGDTVIAEAPLDLAALPGEVRVPLSEAVPASDEAPLWVDLWSPVDAPPILMRVWVVGAGT